jgi:hypothetical protein
MNRLWKIPMRLAAVTVLFTACQSHSYRLTGEASDFSDGDTLQIVDAISGKLIAQPVVEDRHFEVYASTDTTLLCFVEGPDIATGDVSFFLEPGNIHLEVKKIGERSRVSGTHVNNEWQRLLDQLAKQDTLIRRTAALLQNHDLSASQRQTIFQRIQEQETKMRQLVNQAAQRNKDNAMGRFVEEHFQETPHNDL